MRPSVSTTGVNARVTPNFLKSTDGGHVAQLPAIGYGNSPPARKLAVSPEIAVRLGSASTWPTLAVSNACTVAGSDLPKPKPPGTRWLLAKNALLVPPWELKLTIADPKAAVPLRLMPSCLDRKSVV